ncbi:glycosyltransferase family A protein [Micromonospora sp. NBC_01813]|uniref:glycosyltransferase family A protein n=1 Tax=Micromonospora sp. NBC_01813 TaxID=2975988 RepID=UPI003FA3AD99
MIPTYNRAELLGYTLESLTRQTLAAERFEVSIGDDGSTDHTTAVIDRYRDRLELRHIGPGCLSQWSTKMAAQARDSIGREA